MSSFALSSMLFFLAIFAMIPTPASAITVSEFQELDASTRSDATVQIITGTFNALAQNGASDERLACIEDLFTVRDEESDDVKGFVSFLEEYHKARVAAPETRVEDIILGVMDAHCPISTD